MRNTRAGWVGINPITFPHWDTWKWGLLDWEKTINPLACGIKCAAKVSTVSPGYLEELRYDANGLENLFEYERGKCYGILNGIDSDVWDPENDTYIEEKFGIEDFQAKKADQ